MIDMPSRVQRAVYARQFEVSYVSRQHPPWHIRITPEVAVATIECRQSYALLKNGFHSTERLLEAIVWRSVRTTRPSARRVSRPIRRQMFFTAPHARSLTSREPRRANFTLKLVRPDFGPAAELPPSSPARRRHGGCTSRHGSLNLIRGNRRAAPASARGLGRTA